MTLPCLKWAVGAGIFSPLSPNGFIVGGEGWGEGGF